MKKWLSYFFIGLGLLNIGMLILLYSLGAYEQSENFTLFIVGPFLLIFGVRSLGRPMYWLTDEGLEIYNMFGMRLRVTPMAQLDVGTEADGRRKLFRLRDNGRRSLVFSNRSFSLNAPEVDALMDAVEARSGAAAPT